MSSTKEMLRDLVRFRGFEDGEVNRSADYIQCWLKEHDVPCQEVPCEGVKNIVATIGQGDRCLILNAHMDVVQNDPKKFEMREEGDRLIGPAIFDMKGSIAVLMELLAELHATPLQSRVMVQFVSDEETGGHRGTAFLAKNGYQGDFLICCEPTHLKISVQSKGAFFVKISVTGKAAHGSRPWLGENAILKGIKLYEALQQLPFISASSPLFKCATVHLTKIEGGDSLNKVPDSCRLYLDCRYLPGQKFTDVMEQLQGVCRRYEAKLELIRHQDAVVTPLNHPTVEQLHTVCKRHFPETTLFGQDGSSDAHFYTPLGIPGIEFGPAGGGQHSTEEFIEYPKLLLYKKILKEFILNF